MNMYTHLLERFNISSSYSFFHFCKHVKEINIKHGLHIYCRISNNSYTPWKKNKRWFTYSNLFVHIKIKLLFYCLYSGSLFEHKHSELTQIWWERFQRPQVRMNMFFWVLVLIIQAGMNSGRCRHKPGRGYSVVQVFLQAYLREALWD